MVHEWHEETVEDTFSGKLPHPLIARLKELERDGWTIHSVSAKTDTTDNDFKVVCFKDAPS